MKKVITLCSILLASGISVAQGGFKENPTNISNTVINTISAAKQAYDDAPVSIEGNIIEKIDNDEFIFRDMAGEKIKIDVSDHAWNGLEINPNTRIIIQGTVDKEYNKVEIDVKNIIKK